METKRKRVEIRCPHCGQRLMDILQTTDTSGGCVLETKCQRCHKVLTIRVRPGQLRQRIG